MINCIKIGDEIPNVSYFVKEGSLDKIKNTHSEFVNKRVLILSIPGPFLVEFPSKMIHAYSELATEITDLGIDNIYLTSNCDYYTLRAWQKQERLENLSLFPDGNSSWAREVGFLIDNNFRHLGLRSHRYVMILDNLIMKKTFYEDITADPQNCFLVCNVENIMQYLKRIQDTWESFK
jgi:peroxiredoxin